MEIAPRFSFDVVQPLSMGMTRGDRSIIGSRDCSWLSFLIQPPWFRKTMYLITDESKVAKLLENEPGPPVPSIARRRDEP
jgi:hypothetical protein